MAQRKYKFNVTMTCGGCSGAVERVLKKTEGTTPPSLLPQILTCYGYGRGEILRRLPRQADRRHHDGRERRLCNAVGEDQEDGEGGE